VRDSTKKFTMREHYLNFTKDGDFGHYEAWSFAALMVGSRRLSGPQLKELFDKVTVDYNLVRPFHSIGSTMRPGYEWAYQF
jgi:hypothetical protein